MRGQYDAATGVTPHLSVSLTYVDCTNWARLVNVEPMGVGAFYDLTVPGPANYLANGIFHHNSGKTMAAAHYVDAQAMAHPNWRIAIAAPTLGDARTICVEGETGLLGINPRIEFNRSWGEIRWPNGAKGQLFGAYTPEDAERWRGPQHHLVWAEELAAWRQLDTCWDMMRLGLRLGERPRVVIPTTPKARKRLISLLADPHTTVTTAHTDDNPYLHPDVRAELYAKYAGTRLGEQELAARLLLDTPGALWVRERLDEHRRSEAPDMARVVVAVDPSGGDGPENDEQGIVVCGKGVDGRGYVLADRTCKLSPDGWGRRAVKAYLDHAADRIVYEQNFGGQMVESVIKTAAQAMGVEVATKAVHASRGKAVRAEPIAALDEQGRISLVGSHPALEDELCSWTPESGKSPNILDA
ncbi:MAG TPA: terminase family protein, partial [Chloroflexota bacterium]|nr:terminase family protein [Chloroflexota bacterium]